MRFSLPAGSVNPNITFWINSDNAGTYYINGTQVTERLVGDNGRGLAPVAPSGCASGVYCPAGVRTAAMQSALHGGVNEMLVIVEDWGGASGFNFRADVTVQAEEPIIIVPPAPTQVPTTTALTFSGGQYTGSSFAGSASAVVSPGGGVVAISYSGDCVNVGSSCTATATYAGDATHLPSNASKSITITRAPSVTTVTGGGTFVYSGAAHPLTATATGAGGLNASVPVGGCVASPTNVTDSCTGTANFPGDANHFNSTGSAVLTITEAPSVVTMSGTGTFEYDGTTHTMTATATGAGGLNEAVVNLFDCRQLTDVGTCTGTAFFSGGLNHSGSQATGTITITPAASTVTITGGGTFVYDATGHALRATVTGVGGLNFTVPVVGCVAAPMNVADSCTGTATYAGDQNHTGSSATTEVTITPAPSTTKIVGGGTFVYDGTPHVLVATATGVGGLNVSVPVTGCVPSPADVADSCTAFALFHGGPNHEGSKGSTNLTITLAPSTTTLSGTGFFVYDGTAHSVTAMVTGAGGLNAPVLVTGCVANPTDVADFCLATALFTGDANHTASSASAKLAISPAPSTTVVSGGGTFVTVAVSHPLTATVTGAGGLNAAVPVVGCVAAPTNVADSCVGTATYAGDANHLGSSATASLTITKASSTVTVSGGGSFTYTGSGHPLTAKITGVGGLDQTLPVVGCGPNPTLPADNCSGTATFAGDANHLGSTGTASVAITIPYVYPAGGVFVVGNQSPHGLLSQVTFWDSQWAKTNSLSGGGAPSSFKGFENTVAAPACGSTWTTSPGASSGPPASIGQYMVVVVSSNITKSGPTISGNVVQVLVVKTDAGYGPNPGHAGTGKVLQILCTAP